MSSKAKIITLPTAGDTATDRRHGPDRRRHSWRTVTYCGLHGRGRRHQVRRAGQNYYLDWYEPRLVLTGLALFLFSCLDALFTLTLLSKGAYEANVFMAKLLHVGVEVFVATKVLLTGVGVLFLLMHSQFQILRMTNGKRVLEILLLMYGALLVYEVVLLVSIR